MTVFLPAYLAELDQLYRTGHATEHSYRPALQRLLAALDHLDIRHYRRIIAALNATENLMRRVDEVLEAA